MADMSTASVRPMLAAVDNTVASRTSLDDEHRGSPGKTACSPTSDSSSCDSTSLSSSTLARGDKVTFAQTASVQPHPIRSSSSASVSGRPSSVASSGSLGAPAITAASSSHSNLSASLLTPTLASALGITPSAWRKRHGSSKQYTSPLPPSTSSVTLATTSSGQAWSRRPSLPSLSSGSNDRMSMYSVASFESLPEGENAPVNNLVSSPKTSAIAFPDASHSHDSHPLRRDTNQTRRRLGRADRRDKSPAGDAKDPIWAKRRNIARELLETEKVFVQSLRIINDHYYQPLLALSRGQTPESMVNFPNNARPTLSRKAINEIFSNFGDILHLNSELLVRLEERLSGQNREPPNSRPVSMVLPTGEGEAADTTPPPAPVPWDAHHDLIGDLLAPMAPFLKMYSFYVKNFSSALTRIEGERKANETFARFLKETERITWMTTSGGRTEGFGFGLGLQAHLLTIVQRIPRYKLLVGELVKCTPALHKDHVDLCRAYRVIEQVAETINDNIRQHEMVLSMLNIQRLLVGMPVPLIVPGRALLKRATLLKAGRKDIHAREFFLFTDCVIYAAPPAGPMVDATAAWQAFSRYGVGTAEGSSSPVASPTVGKRPAQLQVRASSPDKRLSQLRRRTTSVPIHVDPKRVSFTTLEGQQLQYRDKYALQDCTVVGVEDATSNDPSLRHCFEIRTPGKSFAVYAESYEAKQEWLTSIRNAREELMSNRRTLQADADEDSILAKRDRRRSLQAFNKGIAFPRSTNEGSPRPIADGTKAGASALRNEESRSRRESFPASFSTAASLAAYLGGSNVGDQSPSSVPGSASGNAARASLKVLEDYNAPVWVPDSRADKCACCSEGFGLWRRKHHCRLCGQVVCWSCSQRSFLIAGDDEGEQDRPARACDPCYDSVFPDTPEPSIAGGVDSTQGMSRSSKAFDSDVSLPSCPPTPPAGSEATTPANTLAAAGGAPSIEEFNEEHARECDDASMPLPQMRRNRSFSPPYSHDSVESSAPATRIAKAHALEARLFNGQMLSPQVHAATSGSGTFRLVTPRLTTPENERPPPFSRSAQTHDGRLGNSGDGDQQPHGGLDAPSAAYGSAGASPALTENGKPISAGADGGDYFSGVNIAKDFTSAMPFPSFLAPRRRKPMSAAARLSSVYGALPPSTSSTSTTNPPQS